VTSSAQSEPGDDAASACTAARFVEDVTAGSAELLAWLQRRVERRAAPQFSPWAWEWAREDFVAELSLQLLVTVRKPGFELHAPFESYIDTCISNLCRTWFRRIARLRAGLSLDDLSPDAEPQAASTVEHVALALDMRRALLALDPACRELLVGKYVMGWSMQEIGDRAGVSGARIQSRLHACRDRLRKAFEALDKRAARKSRKDALHGRRK
jgi:RNA polymerase sigma factor (sigma-70 family)